MEVSRWIEEMHPEKALAKGFRASFDELLHRDAGRVRRHDRSRRDHRFQPGVQLSFRLELLDDRLDDQLAVGQQLQVVARVAAGG